MKTDKQTDRQDRQTDICVNKQTFSRTNTARHQEMTVQTTIFVNDGKNVRTRLAFLDKMSRVNFRQAESLVRPLIYPGLFDFHFSSSWLIYLPDFLFLTHCMLVNFSCLCCHTDFFSKHTFSKYSFRNTIKVPNVRSQICHF